MGGTIGQLAPYVGAAFVGAGAAGIPGIIGVGDEIRDRTTPSSAPSAEGNPGLDQLLKSQLASAQTFRQNLPTMKNQASQNLRNQANENMNQGINQVKQGNARRGLSYGGINESQQGQIRSETQSGLAKSINTSNVGYENAANTMDAQALSTAYGVQHTQQQIQNDLYSQSMAQMNSNNAMMGGLIGSGLLVAAI